jgi:signal peptidase I
LTEKYLPADFKTLPGLFAKECQNMAVGKNEYFTLGDNRSHSSDSREWGMVPRDLIIGKARLRYWPPDRWGIVPQTAR